jgi:hypothetical protein
MTILSQSSSWLNFIQVFLNAIRWFNTFRSGKLVSLHDRSRPDFNDISIFLTRLRWRQLFESSWKLDTWKLECRRKEIFFLLTGWERALPFWSQKQESEQLKKNRFHRKKRFAKCQESRLSRSSQCQCVFFSSTVVPIALHRRLMLFSFFSSASDERRSSGTATQRTHGWRRRCQQKGVRHAGRCNPISGLCRRPGGGGVVEWCRLRLRVVRSNPAGWQLL